MADQLISQGAKIIADGVTTALSAANVMSVKDLGISNAKIANATIALAKMGFNLSSEVETIVLTGAATSIDFTGLDLETDQVYMFIAMLKAAASTGAMSLYVNGDATAGNYDRQFILSDGANTTSAHQDNATIADWANSTGALIVGFVSKVAGRPTSILAHELARDTPQAVLNSYITTFTTNCTQLTFTSAAANGIASTSFVKLYKLT